ncbi:MAG: SDR family oxidoreductase [Thermoleophilia bacterium]|nr:SDR family oxidoreductase [Thermoleophilia bacterium]
MSDLTGKVALVTGAAAKRSMGRGIAVQLAKDGADVVVSDKFAVPATIWAEDQDWKGLDDVVAEIRALCRKGVALTCDVSNSADVEALVDWTLEECGKIDILVHCVGVRGPVPVPVVELSEDTWRMLVDVNLTGAFLVCKTVAKTMIPDPEGKKIVLISSMAGVGPYPGGAGYCASKHGLLGLMKTLARELAPHKINVNAINPGGFDTNFRDDSVAKQAEDRGVSVEESQKAGTAGPTGQAGPPPIPLGRLGTPQDIADLVSFLVSDQAKYITGEDINLSGGAS